MKEHLVRIDSPVVTPDDFEDLLATDSLFIDYFNAFLALPTFPEPLVFNKKTGGFEILTNAREQLATEIKAAVRANRPHKAIYRAVRKHAFRPIPLIPMEEPPQEEVTEIDTSFIVQTLNKEQGIEWIKKERLPSFLRSEYYLEYRLAHLLSQLQGAVNPGSPASVRIDRAPRAPTPKKVKEEVTPERDENEFLKAPLPEELAPEPEDPIQYKEEEPQTAAGSNIVAPNKAQMMKDLFVCMGSASTTDTAAWVSQAKMAHTTMSTSCSLQARPSSAILPSPLGGRASSRPFSGVSGRPFSALSTADSGIGSSTKLSTQGSTLDMTTSHYAQSLVSQDADDACVESEVESQMTHSTGPNSAKKKTHDDKSLSTGDHKPSTPRPSDTVCITVETGKKIERGRKGGPVYILPRPSTPNEEDEEDEETVEQEGLPVESSIQPLEGDRTLSSSQEDGDGLTAKTTTKDSEQSNLLFHDIDEMGSVIVGQALKRAIAATTGQTEDEVLNNNPVLSNMCPLERTDEIKNEDVERLEYSSEPNRNKSSKNDVSTTPTSMDNRGPESKPWSASAQVEKNELTLTLTMDESDGSDSLLDSDEDYDEDRDKIFKKKKSQFKLTNKKGVEKFRQFLRGKSGEKNWYFWLDVDRGRMMINGDEVSGYLAAMRERYQQPGAPYELSRENKVDLGLTEPSQWTLEKLFNAQNKMGEPLLLYWAPRFLIQQYSPARPERNYLYNLHRQRAPLTEAHPNPPTINLLPLRPKTCMPRINQREKTQISITSMFEQGLMPQPDTPVIPSTTPVLGMKRTHSLPDMYKPAEKREKENHQRQSCRPPKTPKQLVSARSRLRSQQEIPHPPPAPKGFRSQRSRSARSSDQWDTLSNLSLPSTVHSQPDTPRSRRPRSAPTHEDTASEISCFLGGRRMEGLLQALAAEKKSGGVIRSYLDLVGNQLWLNSLSFWHELQEYHRMFYADALDVYLLEKKARSIFAKYIVAGAPHNLQCTAEIRISIQDRLLPPYEELFDAAEELVIELLFEAWRQMIVSDLSTFDKVELLDVKRHIDTRSRYMVTLQRRGIIKEPPQTPEDPMTAYQDPVYDESLIQSIPEDFRDYSLEKLVHNRIELEHFRHFLNENYASMDLLCWMDIEAFRRTPHKEESKRDLRAKDIKTKYMNKKYFFGPNSPAGKEGQEKVMAVGGGWGKLLDDRPPTASLLEAQKYVRARLEKKWLPLFLATPEFADRQRPKSSMDDVVEDVMIQKKKKSQAIWRMLESRWVSSSKDIITFRKALMNPISSLQFRRFVSIKGDNYENDVLFWQEIQRYKDLCHLHSDRSLIQQKTITIINCFIDSPIPPALQVDITQEMADRLVERKLEATPYLFREAQLTVFRVLFPYWSDFCHFRQNLASDKILPTIERHRRRAKAEEKRRQEQARERKEKEIARRRALGLPIDVEEDEGYREGQHEMPSSDEEDDADVGSEVVGEDAANDHQVAWSYSGYMNALEEEKVLNDVDEATFSCVSESSSKMQDIIPILFTQPEDVSGKEHIELTDRPPSRKGSVRATQRSSGESKPRSRPSSGGSLKGQRPKSSGPRSVRP